MRDYGRVHCAFWTSRDIERLSDDARILALYLLTGPHTTISGAFRLPDLYVSEDLRWPLERVRKGFDELLANGFANRCETTKWVWICKFLDWNTPENPNQWKAARKLAAQVPEHCTWRIEFQRLFARKAGDPEPPTEPSGNPSGTVTQTVSKSGSGSGTVLGTVTGAEHTQRVCAREATRESGSDVGPENAWRDITECDREAYENWLDWRQGEHDPVPPRVRLEHAKFLAGKGTPEQQRAFVAKLIQLEFRRLHDPIGHGNGTANGSAQQPVGRTWQPDDDEESVHASV